MHQKNESIKRLALSVRQPWAWLIIAGYKSVENRTWIPRLSPGSDLAIHASKAFDPYAFDWIFDRFPHLRDMISPAKHSYERGGIVGIVEYHGFVSQADDWYHNPWFVGPYGWIFGNPRRIEFVPCRGQLGLFEVEIGTREGPHSIKRLF